MKLRYFFFMILILFSCMNERKEKKIKVDQITRKRGDVYYKFEISENKYPTYPFETNQPLAKITKEFFKCKGNPLNPEKIDDNRKIILDCEGAAHSLPLIHGKEGVYPILLDILNYIQNKTQKRVIITSGFSCPKHMAYIDFKKEMKISKHMMGAEVDFYVSGYEKKGEKIIDLVKEFYENSKKSELKTNPLKQTGKTSWINKEILLTYYKANEKRDFDNRHPYPYISIQVLWDRKTDQKVVFNPDIVFSSEFQ